MVRYGRRLPLYGTPDVTELARSCPGATREALCCSRIDWALGGPPTANGAGPRGPVRRSLAQGDDQLQPLVEPQLRHL